MASIIYVLCVQVFVFSCILMMFIVSLACLLSIPEYIMYVHMIDYSLQTHYIQLGAVMALGHLISAAVSRVNVTAASSDKEHQHIQQTMRKSLYRLGENMSPVIKITLKLMCFYSV